MGTLMKTGRVEAATAATPAQVWAVLADVTRIGEWSHECRGAVWLDGADRAAVGARYRGTNRAGRTRWSRCCTIVTAEPDRELAWETEPSPLYRDSTRWRIVLQPEGDGTRIVQTFEVLKLGRVVERLIYLVMAAHRNRLPALTGDVERLGRIALAEPAAADAVAAPPG